MDRKFIFKLAIRNLWSHKLRTILTLAGVIIGISSVLFLVSFGYGIQKLVTEQITGGDAFQLIDIGTGDSRVVKLNQEMIDKVKAIAGVSSVEVITNLAGKAIKDNNEMDVAFFGTTPEYLNWAGKKIRWGETLPSSKSEVPKLVVNTSYLDFINKGNADAALGSKVKVNLMVSTELSETGEAKVFNDKEFQIIGVIKEDASPAAYTNLDNLDDLKLSSFSQAKVRITDRNQADTIRKNIESVGLKTQYVGDTVNQVEQVFSVFKIVLGSFGLIALLVALLGMFNTLTISLLERVKEVALMKIIGMNRKDIRNLFIIEALLLGVSGGVIGAAWGVVLGKIANSILNYFAVAAGGDRVIVFDYPLVLMISVVVIAIFIGFVTGIYPAKRAESVDALDVLRYE
jgi:putative ABC transport system permease protein